MAGAGRSDESFFAQRKRRLEVRPGQSFILTKFRKSAMPKVLRSDLAEKNFADGLKVNRIRRYLAIVIRSAERRSAISLREFTKGAIAWAAKTMQR